MFCFKYSIIHRLLPLCILLSNAPSKGYLVSLHGTAAQRFWCWHYVIHGKSCNTLDLLVSLLCGMDGCIFSDLPCDQVPVYIAEIAPQEMRGGLGSLNEVLPCFPLPYYLVICFVNDNSFILQVRIRA